MRPLKLIPLICTLLLLTIGNLLYATNVFSPSIVSNSSTINGCSDVVQLVMYCEITSSQAYELRAVLPAGVVPQMAGAVINVQNNGSNTTQYVSTGTTYTGLAGVTQSWTSSNKRISVNIPANFMSGANFNVVIPLYVTCGAASNLSVASGVYQPTNTLWIAGTTESLPTVNSPTLQLTSAIGTPYNASPGETGIIERFNLCATGPGTIYNVRVTTPALLPGQTAKLTNGITDYPLTTTASDVNLQTAFGSPLSSGDCITLEVGPYTAPTICTTETHSYTAGIICNAGVQGVQDYCNATVNQQIRVTSLDNKIGMAQYTLIQGGATVASIKPCSAFNISQVLTNTITSGQSAADLAKVFKEYSVTFDPDWIDATQATVKVTWPGGTTTPSITPVVSPTGVLTATFPTGITAQGGQTITVVVENLIPVVNGGYAGPACVLPTNDKAISNATISYTTNCDPVNWVVHTGNPVNQPNLIYANNFGMITNTYATVNGIPGGDVTPNQYPKLYFTWNQTAPNGNPWTNFKTQGTSNIKQLFNCTSTTYEARLKIHNPGNTPNLVTLVAAPAFYLHYSDELGTVNPIPLVPQPDGSYIAQLPVRYPTTNSLGNNVVMWVQEKLGDCPPNHTGATIPTTLDLIAVCNNNTAPVCTSRYCFEQLTNILNVHCPGVCNSTGIGTEGLLISNQNAAGVQAAYPCDVVRFHAVGRGYNAGIPPINTEKIYLRLTYPALTLNGTPDPIFDFSAATATYTYPGGSNLPINSADIGTPQPGQLPGTWEVTVGISSQADCQSIRAYGNQFSINLDVPVRCDLPFDLTKGQGNYSLNGIMALYEYKQTNNAVYYSCDGITSGFRVIAHQQTTTASFPVLNDGDVPCVQTLTIHDAAGYGGVVDEMPGHIRPLIEWPTDGVDNNAIAITYPSNMTINSITYVDATGVAPSGTSPQFSAPVSTGSNLTTTYVYGFTGTGTDPYMWPAFTKSTLEFFRDLQIEFNPNGCSAQTVTVTVPHRTRDKVGGVTCSTSGNCMPLSTVSLNAVTSTPNTLLSLNYNNTTGQTVNIGVLNSLNFSLPYNLDNPSQLDHVFIRPVATNNYTWNATTSINSTPIPLNNYYDYYSMTGNNNNATLNVSFNTGCAVGTQSTILQVGYNCSGNIPDPGNGHPYCGVNSSTKLTVGIKNPVLAITTTNASDTRLFGNCKGSCEGDDLLWKFQITNTLNSGPAYMPRLLVETIGPGMLSIAGVQIQYVKNGVVHNSPEITYPPVTTTTSDILLASILPLWGNSADGYYMRGATSSTADVINVTVRLHGDGENCAFDAQVKASVLSNNICGTAQAAVSRYDHFYFNTNVCPTNQPCSTAIAGTSAWQACDPCAYGSPMNVVPSITNPSCTGAANGSISLIVSGGPSTYDPATSTITFPTYTFAWSNGLGTSASLTNLAAGTYTVTITNQTCAVVRSYTLTNSGLTTSATMSHVSCKGASNGSIDLTVTNGSAYTYLWSTGATTQDITGLAAGNYTVTVTSAVSGTCTPTAILDVTITEPANGIDVTTASTDIGCNSTAGVVQVTALNFFTAPVTYAWSPGSYNGSMATVPAGNYTVTVTDAKNCIGTATAVVATVSTPISGAIQPPYPQAPGYCSGTSALLNFSAPAFSGQATDITYTLYNGTTTTGPFTTSVTFNSYGLGIITLNLTNGGTTTVNYTLTVTGIITPACTTAVNVTSTQFGIKPIPQLTITPPAVTTICPSNGSINLVANGGVPVNTTNANYTWYRPNNSTATARSITGLTSASQSGTYTVVYKDPTTSCTASQSINITTRHTTVSVEPITICGYPATITPVATANCTFPACSLQYKWSAGSTTYTTNNINTPYTVTAAHTARVSVYDGYCTTTATRAVSISPNTVTVTGGTQVCSGGQIQVFVTTGNMVLANTNPYTWPYGIGTNNNTSQVYTVTSSPTTYTVSVTDNFGCVKTASTTATLYQPTVTTSVTPGVQCHGGTATATASGSANSGVFTYEWKDASNTVVSNQATASNLAGNYTVVATDVYGCSASATASVSSPGNAIGISLQASAGCSNSVTITSTVTGGDGLYSYTWSNGASGASLPFAEKGNTYTLTVTDAHCCTASASITIDGNYVLGVSLLSENSACGIPANDALQAGRVVNVALGGTTPMTFAWSNGATTQNIERVTAGLYSLTITDANGCTATASAAVSDGNPGFTVTGPAAVDPATVNCSSTNALPDVTASGVTIDWYGPGGTFAYTSAAVYPPGLYHVVLSSTTGCTVVKTIDLTPQLPTLSLSNTAVSCYGLSDGSATATATGSNLIYNWSNSATTATNTGLSATTYTVTVSNSVTGCSATSATTVNSPPQLAANITLTGSACGATAAANVTATGGKPCYSYLWHNAATTAGISGLVAGSTASVVVTDASGCSVSASASVPNAITVTLQTVNPVCHGGTGTITATPANGTAPYSYNWNTTETTNEINPVAGTYTVTVTDAANCTATATVTLTQPAALSVSLSKQDVLCYGTATGSVTASVTNGATPLLFNWNNDINLGTANTVTGIDAAGTYYVTVTDNNDCVASSQITVSAPSAPLSVTAIVTNANCTGSPNSIALSYSGGTPDMTYNWNDPMGNPGGPLQSNTQGEQLPGTIVTGTYFITITDANMCNTSTSAVVTGQPYVSITGSATAPGCNGGSNGTIAITPGTGTSPYTYSWTGPGINTSNETVQNPTALVAGSYLVTVTDVNSCFGTAQFTVTEPTAISISEIHTDPSCGGADGSITLTASGGTPGYSYQWAGSNGATISNIGTGTYSATVTDANGCNATTAVALGNGLSAVTVSCQSCEYVPHENAYVDFVGLSFNFNGPAGSFVTVETQSGSPVALTISGNPSTGLYDGALQQGANNLLAGIVTASATSSSEVLIITVRNAAGVPICTQSINLTIDCTPATAFPNCTNSQIEFTTPVVVCNGIDYSTGLPRYIASFDIINNTGSYLVGGALSCAICDYSDGGSNGPAINPGTTHMDVEIDVLTANASSVTLGYVFVDENFCGLCRKELVISLPAINFTPDVTVVNANCLTNATGSITLNSVSGGTSPYTQQWYDWSYGTSVTNLNGGSYDLTITDADGCAQQFTYTISNGSTLSATTTVANTTCGNNNGSITVTATGGSGNYVYQFNNQPISPSPTLSGLANGTYTVTVIDGACNTTATATIGDGVGPVTQVCHSCQPMLNPATNVQLYTFQLSYSGPAGVNISAVSQLGSYVFFTTTGDPNATVTTELLQGVNNIVVLTQPYSSAATSDVITLELTDANGSVVCSMNQNVAIDCNTNQQPPACSAPNITFSNLSVTCNGLDYDGIPLYQATFDMTNALGNNLIGGSLDCNCEYHDDIDDALILQGTQTIVADIKPLTTGATSVQVLYTFLNPDLCGLCSHEMTINLPVSGILPNPIVVDAECANNVLGSINLSPWGGTSPYSYNWSNGESTASIENLTGGTYMVTITDDDNCGKVFSYNVADGSTVLVNETHTNPTCGAADGSITLTGSGGTSPYTYAWNSGATTATLSGLLSGTYMATVTDATGCNKTISVTVSDDIGAVTQMCHYCQVLPTTGDVGNFYSLQFNYTGPAGVTVSAVSQGGNYIGFTTTGSPSTSLTTNVSAGINNVLVFAVPLNGNTSDIITLEFRDANNIVYCSVNVPVNFDCTNSFFPSCDGSGSPFNFTNMNVVCDGIDPNTGNPQYLATWNVVNAYTGTVMGGQIDCNNCDIDENNNNPVYTVGANPVQATIVPLDANATSVDLTYVFVDESFCGLCNRTLTINLPASNLQAGLNVVNASCGGTGSASVSPSGGTPPYSVNWSTGATTTSVSNLSPGNYTVEISDAAGCGKAYNFTIYQSGGIAGTGGVKPSCYLMDDGYVHLLPAGGLPPYSYQWSHMVANSPNADNLTPGTYYVTITSANGCSVAESYQIWETQPGATGACESYGTCSSNTDASITLFPQCLTQPCNITPFSYLWSDGQTTQTATNLATGQYYATVYDRYGCTISTSLFVLFEQDGPISASGVPSFNCSTNEGSIDLTVTGGIACGNNGGPCHQYIWSNGADTEDLTGLAPGTYSVTVTDGGSCIHNGQSWLCQATTTVTVTSGGCKTDGVDINNGEETSQPENNTLDEEIASNTMLKLVPNPTRDNVTVVYTLKQNEKAELKLYDLAGRLVLMQELTEQQGTTVIPLGKLESGTYTYKSIGNQGSLHSGKLVVINQ